MIWENFMLIFRIVFVKGIWCHSFMHHFYVLDVIAQRGSLFHQNYALHSSLDLSTFVSLSYVQFCFSKFCYISSQKAVTRLRFWKRLHWHAIHYTGSLRSFTILMLDLLLAMYLASLKRSYWMSAMVSDLPFIVKFLWLCILRKYWQLSEDLVLWMCWNFLIICAVWICCNPVQANKCYLGDFRYLYRSNWFYIQAAS